MTRTHVSPDWIAVDWGTSRLRAWAIGPNDEIVAHAASDDGMNALRRDSFEPALLSLIEPWLGPGTTKVIACGMVGARQGWQEVRYVEVPAIPSALTPEPVTCCQDPRLSVRIVPGLAQTYPADVMRGEETQIAGFLTQEPDFDGMICLPGTHSKWVRIREGQVTSFQTFMTGEVFHLLSRQSVLRHSVGDDTADGPQSHAAFEEGVLQGLARPERLLSSLFAIRAASLLDADAPCPARARLSGLLVGAELAAARGQGLGRDVAIVGAPELSASYAAALKTQGISARVYDADSLTLAGLICARAGTAGRDRALSEEGKGETRATRPRDDRAPNYGRNTG